MLASLTANRGARMPVFMGRSTAREGYSHPFPLGARTRGRRPGVGVLVLRSLRLAFAPIFWVRTVIFMGCCAGLCRIVRDYASGAGVGEVMRICQTKPRCPIELAGWLRGGFARASAADEYSDFKDRGRSEFHETQEGGRLGCLRFHLSMPVVRGRGLGAGKGLQVTE